MFLLNSRLGLFTAAWLPRRPFSLSYGTILPSSLTTVLSLALGFSPHLPVSVCGTGTLISLEAFPDSVKSEASLLFFAPHHTSEYIGTDLPIPTPSILRRTFPTVRSSYPSVSPHRSNNFWWYGNLNPLSITYALQPWLRPRLTLRGRTFLRKP